MMFSRPRPISQSIVRRKLARSSTTRVSACLAPPESRLRGTGHPHHDPVYDRPARSGTARAGPQRPTPSTTLRPPRCGSCGGGRGGTRAREVGRGPCPAPRVGSPWTVTGCSSRRGPRARASCDSSMKTCCIIRTAARNAGKWTRRTVRSRDRSVPRLMGTPRTPAQPRVRLPKGARNGCVF